MILISQKMETQLPKYKNKQLHKRIKYTEACDSRKKKSNGMNLQRKWRGEIITKQTLSEINGDY